MNTRRSRDDHPLLLLRFAGLAALVTAFIAAAPSQEEERAPGIIFEGFEMEGTLRGLPRLSPEALPNVARIVDRIEFRGESNNFEPLKDNFYCRLTGFLKIPRDGRYGFRLLSDDGSRLKIGDELVIDHDGMHATTPKSAVVSLRRGEHPFLVEHFDGGGADSLTLEWQPPGQREWTVAPAPLFLRPAGKLPKTADGKKKVHQEPSPTEGLERDRAVARALDLGVEYLLGQIAKKQPAQDRGAKNSISQMAFELYALLVAGVPEDDPVIRAGLEYIEDHIFERPYTYALACAIFAHDAAISQLQEDALLVSPPSQRKKILSNASLGRAHRKRILRYTDALLAVRNKTGGWKYFKEDGQGDISSTQYAIHALGVAARYRARIPLEVWVEATEYVISLQAAEGEITRKRLVLQPEEEKRRRDRGLSLTGEGPASLRKSVRLPIRDPIVGTEEVEVRARGFEYSRAGMAPIENSEWNRAAAAVSSLLIVYDHCAGQFPPEKLLALLSSIRDGYGYLLEKWDPFRSYYGIHVLEKVGDIGGIQRFGDKDWFDEATRWLLENQELDGSWTTTAQWGENDDRVTTAFSLLVLKRATSLLTRNPAEFVIVSGAGEERQTRGSNREWVYVEELDTSVHVPELLRTVRYRPRRPLLKLLSQVVAAYDVDLRPELIPALLDLRDRIQGKSSQKILDSMLSDIVGRELDTDPSYLEWHQRWARVAEAGEGSGKDLAADLVEIYRDPSSGVTLKRAVIRAATKIGAREIIPLLVEDLGSPERELRALCHRALTGLFTETPPPFDPDAPDSKRAEQLEELRRWVRKREG